MVRVLSQTGFHRLPKNPRQRNFGEGGTKTAGTVLDKANERFVMANVTLHPTKGVRRFNPKRSAAAMIVAQIRAGQLPFSTRIIRREMRLAELQAGRHG